MGVDCKNVSCHGSRMFYTLRCFSFITISLPSVNAGEWSAPQIGQDSSIYILDIILGWVYDAISHLICIFYTLSWELMQIFANGKQCIYSFMEFYVIHLKNIKGLLKIWSRCYFKAFGFFISIFLVFSFSPLLQFSFYLLLDLLPVQEFLHHEVSSRPPCKQSLFYDTYAL